MGAGEILMQKNKLLRGGIVHKTTLMESFLSRLAIDSKSGIPFQILNGSIEHEGLMAASWFLKNNAYLVKTGNVRSGA
ncbi:MAG: hypothetical protein HRT36_03285 [Alphaproteobacteria bacterium]|nr:hypothetical protein [Alphaproteobacteria bacterium]